MWLVPRLREWRWPGRVAAVVGLWLFVVPPHWALPKQHNRELDWALWQHVVGNEFVWCALALLIAFAVGRVGAPRVARQTAAPCAAALGDAVAFVEPTRRHDAML
jgi:alpha-1,2-mannosyltransferase